MTKLLTINQAAKQLGVAKKTIRRWETSGKITSKRTAGGHRRFDISKLRRQVDTLKTRSFNSRQVVNYMLVSAVVTALITIALLSARLPVNSSESQLNDLDSLPTNLELIDLPSQDGSGLGL